MLESLHRCNFCCEARGHPLGGLGRPHHEGHRGRREARAARRGALGARTVRATAAAVGNNMPSFLWIDTGIYTQLKMLRCPFVQPMCWTWVGFEAIDRSWTQFISCDFYSYLTVDLLLKSVSWILPVVYEYCLLPIACPSTSKELGSSATTTVRLTSDDGHSPMLVHERHIYIYIYMYIYMYTHLENMNVHIYIYIYQ